MIKQKVFKLIEDHNFDLKSVENQVSVQVVIQS